jgi:ABC-type transporter Mla maintaining outer membrane lipid asymmetry ATPase subunit MlaF
MTEAPEPVLSLEQVSLEAGNAHVHELTLMISPGEAVAVLGSRRSGKLDVLQLCAGLRTPTSGTVRLLGQDLWALSLQERTALLGGVPYVHDPPLFLSNVRLYDNLALPLRYHSALDEPEIRTRVAAAVARAGIDQYEGTALPMMCSRQLLRRASYARAFSVSPRLLVIEELAAASEEGGRDWMTKLLLEHRRSGGAVLGASLLPEPIEGMIDRVLLMDRGQVVAAGEPAQLTRKGALTEWRAHLREDV